MLPTQARATTATIGVAPTDRERGGGRGACATPRSAACATVLALFTIAAGFDVVRRTAAALDYTWPWQGGADSASPLAPFVAYSAAEAIDFATRSPILAAEHFEVPRVDVADLAQSQFMADFVLVGRPVVLSGVARPWPAMSAWPDRFATALRSKLVRAETTAGAFGFEDLTWGARDVTYANYATVADRLCTAGLGDTPLSSGGGSGARVDYVRGGDNISQHRSGPVWPDSDTTRVYMATPLPLALAADVDMAPLASAPPSSSQNSSATATRGLNVPLPCRVALDSPVLTEAILWEAQAGCAPRSLIHADHTDNLLTVVVGAKNVTLWDPYQAGLLYEREGLDRTSPVDVALLRTASVSVGSASGGFFGDVALESPKTQIRTRDELLRKYPLSARTRSVTVSLRAGDSLFLPAQWFHDVQTAGTHTIALNVWFDLHNGGNAVDDDAYERMQLPRLAELIRAKPVECNPRPSLTLESMQQR